MQQTASLNKQKRRPRLRARVLLAAAWAALFAIVMAADAVPEPDTATAASSPLLSLIRKNYNPSNPFETKFTLSIYWSVREKQETKRGSITLAPGDRFRVTLGNETFVSDGTTFWHYDAAAKQVVVKHLADVDRASLPSRIFSTYIASYPFRERERNGGSALLEWKSDSLSAPYTSIEVTANVKRGRIEKCTLVDKNDNRFTYTFTGTVFGKRYAKEAFELAIPNNARIIDMRNN